MLHVWAYTVLYTVNRLKVNRPSLIKTSRCALNFVGWHPASIVASLCSEVTVEHG